MQEDAVAQGAGFFVDNALQYGKTEEGQCLHQRHVNGGKEKGGGHTGGKNADSLSEDVVEEASEGNFFHNGSNDDGAEAESREGSRSVSLAIMLVIS